MLQCVGVVRCRPPSRRCYIHFNLLIWSVSVRVKGGMSLRNGTWHGSTLAIWPLHPPPLKVDVPLSKACHNICFACLGKSIEFFPGKIVYVSARNDSLSFKDKGKSKLPSSVIYSLPGDT